ncbi:MAG: metalloregulator ArsR/SmtB family transcription factor [Acholeplasmatales bacterium]|nr:metalloregulator ArsR/SmtB family transcription factor [Acholeplasmatales bacterium]
MDLENIKKNMPNQDEIDKLTNLFKVLGDNTRTKILYTLAGQELCVTDICECVGMNKSAVSHQLRTLKDAKLVKGRKDGKEVYYSFDDDHISIIFNTAIAHIEENR